MREVTSLATEPLQVPRRITIGTKERPAHVVVDAVHVPPELIEKRHRLGADEPAAARHDGSFHDPGPPSVKTQALFARERCAESDVDGQRRTRSPDSSRREGSGTLWPSSRSPLSRQRMTSVLPDTGQVVTVISRGQAASASRPDTISRRGPTAPPSPTDGERARERA